MISWLISTAVSWIMTLSGSSILNDVIAGLTTTGDVNAKVAIEQIRAEVAARQQVATIRQATAGYWEMRLITFLIAGCFTLHLCAVTFDTLFRAGLAIPKYPAPFDEWEGTILCSFFAVQGSIVAVRSIAAAIMRNAAK